MCVYYALGQVPEIKMMMMIATILAIIAAGVLQIMHQFRQ